jgi:CRISPR system Cascade subunit CasB
MTRHARAAVSWWRELQPDPATKRPGDRAALAQLRRCATVAEAMQEPAAIALFRRAQMTRPDDLPLIGLTAAVLAHVREDTAGGSDSLSVARQIGPDGADKPETALLKPLRFRRLMEARGEDERLIAFRRLVALTKVKLDLPDLAAALLDWSERRRRDWIFAYWTPADPASAATVKDTAA